MQQMRPPLLKIFSEERVIDLQKLKKKLKNRSTRSIFRDLLSEGYFSSFTHAGKYYTLKNIPRFNADGIWFYQEIGFAKFGTLKETLIKLIDKSETGKTHDELKKQLHIRVHNTLLDLVKHSKIIRKKIDSDFVYFSTIINVSNKQIEKRENKIQEYKEIGCPDWIVIEMLASIIRTEFFIINPEKVVSELKMRKIIITREQVESTLNQLNLKKTLVLK